eukprot:m.159075 g.159075  ORF g.159075 m.159075 type:complete len:68 (+) comp17991_c0_seq2:1850-2053(+)
MDPRDLDNKVVHMGSKVVHMGNHKGVHMDSRRINLGGPLEVGKGTRMVPSVDSKDNLHTSEALWCLV